MEKLRARSTGPDRAWAQDLSIWTQKERNAFSGACAAVQDDVTTPHLAARSGRRGTEETPYKKSLLEINRAARSGGKLFHLGCLQMVAHAEEAPERVVTEEESSCTRRMN